MSSPGKINYFEQKDIDKTAWDKCIETAPNGLIYGYSFYLDNMSRNWDALVLNDYEAVMPLTWNKKYGIKYLYQPFLAAQLGIFGSNLDAEKINSFLRSIPQEFPYWDISLNQGNLFSLQDFRLYTRMNFILDLNKSYEQIYSRYRENIQRNSKKCLQSGCKKLVDIDVDHVIDLALKQMRSHSKTSSENAKRFRLLYQQLHREKKAITYGILSGKDALLASAVFFYSHSRAYYILVGNHPDGRTTGASHALIDAFIRDHAGQNIILDFEGSDIPNLALFYSGFGALEEKYAAIKNNNLPFYMKWLKK
jgi:hypothetical protein